MSLSPRSKEVLGRGLASSTIATLIISELAAVVATASLNDGSILSTTKLLAISLLVAPLYAGVFVIPLGTLAAAASWPVTRRLDGHRTAAALVLLTGYGLVLGFAIGAALFFGTSATYGAQISSSEISIFGGWGAAFGGLSAATWWFLIPARERAA